MIPTNRGSLLGASCKSLDDYKQTITNFGIKQKMEDTFIVLASVEEVKLFNNQQLLNTATSLHRSIIHISNDF